MPRRLDHIVHAARDLDTAADLYKRLGFVVGARNRHPWGTHNHVVQFQGSFVELLTLAEPEKLGGDGFSDHFGRFNRDFLTRNEGLSLAILESKDIEADHKNFVHAGIASSEPMRFEREGQRPDGSSVKVAFSLAFAKDQSSPDVSFALCQQHYPENFWNAAFQAHPNSVSGLAGIVFVAQHPADHRAFLSALTGLSDFQSPPSTLNITTMRGDIAVLEPEAYRHHFGVRPPSAKSGMRLAAIRFAAKCSDSVRTVLDAAKVPYETVHDRIIIAPELGMGATLSFEPSGG